ncbi:MAG: serine/threonine-protein kinase [Planctomycetota bacterium]
MSAESLDDRLDRLVAEYCDRVQAGESPLRDAYLAEVPSEARPGLERCLKMIDAGIATVPSAARPLVPETKFGRYTLRREVGRGGMAQVWLARDEELERPVALKILRPGLALEAQHVDRFRREALAIARLRHPHIVQVYDVGEAHGYHYLAMELVEGPSLATVLGALPAKRRWSADELARAAGIPALSSRERSFEQALAALLAPVAAALHVAHEQGLIHRDVKPSNILLRPDGTAVVADFGLAKGQGDPALSLTGDTIGTPYYMSPEQAWLAEAKVDHRTDVYSLGVTLYEALGGARPFEGGTMLEVFEAIRTTIPPALRSRQSRVSKDAEALVQRAMARRPADRYASAAELAADLVALAERRPTEARRRRGGLLRRAWTAYLAARSGQPTEYRSPRTFAGLPLLHFYGGRRMPGQRPRVARGWIAAGDIAIGAFASGPVAVGLVAIGGISAGLLFAWGGLAAGLLLAFGGLAVGGLPIGGVAAGYLAFGGAAFGYAAIGGYACGVYALGGKAVGRYLVTNGHADPEAREWFANTVPFLLERMGMGGG